MNVLCSLCKGDLSKRFHICVRDFEVSRSSFSFWYPLVSATWVPFSAIVSWKDAIVDAAEDVSTTKGSLAIQGTAEWSSTILGNAVPSEGTPVMELAFTLAKCTWNGLFARSCGVLAPPCVVLTCGTTLSSHVPFAPHLLATAVMRLKLLAHP